MRARVVVAAGASVLLALTAAWVLQPAPPSEGLARADAPARPLADAPGPTKRIVFDPAPGPAQTGPAPGPPPEPEDPHDPETRAWIALDHRVRDFLGSPLAPAHPPDADPDAEDAALQAAVDARLAELTLLEAELVAIARDTSRPRRSLEATVTLGELYADMGASVEQLPVPADLGVRAARRWARENDARARVHLDKARMLFDIATSNGGTTDPGLGPRIAAGAMAAAPR